MRNRNVMKGLVFHILELVIVPTDGEERSY